MQWNAVELMVTEWGQQHILVGHHNWNKDQKFKFIQAIEQIDYPKMKRAVEKLKKNITHANDSPVKPVERINVHNALDLNSDALTDTGIDVINHSRAAVCILAAGQGTRLGIPANWSKGMMNLNNDQSLVHSIFQLLITKILELRNKSSARASIPLLVMTSVLNHTHVIKFFRDFNFFNFFCRGESQQLAIKERSTDHYTIFYYEKEGVTSNDFIIFFRQGMIPLLGASPPHNLLMSDVAELATGPDGNGSVWSSIRKDGLLEDLISRGVEYIHFISVDNPLGVPLDPKFLGLIHSRGLDLGCKVIRRVSSNEKLGIICSLDNHFHIVEYSDKGASIDNVDLNGEFLFPFGNIGSYVITVSFIRSLSNGKLPYHLAVKKNDIYRPDIGDMSTMETIKLESFIFDALVLPWRKVILLEIEGAEFFPIKDTKSLETVKRMLKLPASLGRSN